MAGTDRPDRGAQDAPDYDLVEEFPDPPQYLNTDGAQMWSDIGRQLVAARVLQVVDLFSLEQLCFAWQCFRRKAKAEMEPTAAETTALKSLFSEFGMTPASRAKVSSGGEKAKGNKFGNNGKRA
ncbi:P27 family phage terminase small subunit [Marinobacter sp. BGYM27]|uniref:P27 family phage terminase small subunit n=1 Tax=Marinobacter sp. BGYM27 TaxID=2975597 RepID=UPI0021A84190|nr:P27 family phage terminase small subunit [Marinobacter sp. BGYM27]MDG5498960.1 P27 family phage terminase small subunit [Marinobacter sp. BGYM27]